jgi:peptide chain release factor 2
MNFTSRIEELRSVLKIEEKKLRIKKIEEEMNAPDFWLVRQSSNDGGIGENDSNQKMQELKALQEVVKKFDDIYELSQIADGEEMEGLEAEVAELEKMTKFTGKYDENSAIINFYAGAGGDDAQDWTQMLLTMYLKWAERSVYSAKIAESSRGAIAGVKNATLIIDGIYAYGKLKGENGVHRLVRQSPFNAKALRQTSFALVEVLPKIEDQSKDIVLENKDLKIDTFRSSGHGGQSVNTTDSAVRITHMPTGIVVTCQNEKSQLQNKQFALSVLKSRLAALMLEQHKEKISELRGESPEPEWGSQIRSYVLHPYKMVKDHRTGHESKNPEAVLGGNLDEFIEAQLKWMVKN